VALGDELAIAHPATHVINQVFALTEAGRLAEAEQLARAGAEIVASHRVPIAQIWFAANLGRVATLQGKVATARRYYAEAAGLAQAHRFAGPRRLALSGLALAHAMLGEADAAARALDDRATLPEITLVQSSFDRLGAARRTMATLFYQQLFRQNPALRPLFTTDLAEQEARFVEKLTEIVLAMPRLDELLLHTRALGARHVGYGVRAGDCQNVGDALIAALAAVLGDDFDAATREAWTLAYNLVAETMLEGAAAARPIGS